RIGIGESVRNLNEEAVASEAGDDSAGGNGLPNKGGRIARSLNVMDCAQRRRRWIHCQRNGCNVRAALSITDRRRKRLRSGYSVGRYEGGKKKCAGIGSRTAVSDRV